MMSRHFSKVGVWLFMAAFAWYMAGNFLLGNLKKEQIAEAEGKHVKEQHADLGSNKQVVIHAPDNNYYADRITLVFDPATTQASINNENLRLAASTQLVDGVFHINMSKVNVPEYHHRNGQTEIRLPASVNKVSLAGIRDLEISGRLPAPEAELTLEDTDCTSQVKMKQLSVNRLKLVAVCQAPPKKECCASNFNLLEQIQVGTLDVAMLYGSLEFSGQTAPRQTLLNVSDNVQITGRRGFLQSLRFNNGSP